MAKNINPVLKNLDILTGSWVMELSNASFLPDPKTTIRGSASFEWFDNGDFFVMRQGAKGSGMPWSVWLIGRDVDASEHTVLYFDDRGVSRVYQMSFEKRTWTIWRKARKFSQRFEGKISKDGKTIKAHWAKSLNGKKWEHDFDITYKRK